MDPLRPQPRMAGPAHARGPAYRRRIGGAILIAGGLLGFATLLVPHTATGGYLSIVLPSSVAILAGSLLFARPNWFPLWATPLFVALGTVLITLATRAAGVSGTGTADNEVLYLLVVLYSFYFLPARQAILQLAFVGFAYGWLLIAEVPLDVGITRWMTTIGTLTLAGLLLRQLNKRVEGLIEELDASAQRDPLTGALNRRGLEERLGIEITRARRTGEPLTVLTADLDGLKSVNDQFGHAAGDEALQLAAVVMAEGLRDVDVLARTGGDEFVILLPACEPDLGLEIAEALRLEMRSRSERESWPATLSLGVAGAPPLPLDPDVLLEAADQALYRAKALGRDRVSVAGDAELSQALDRD
jgi:diguanylate cyclase (GGDEF)-like protein